MHQSGTVSDALVALLAELGVRQAFGIIGGAVAPFARALAHSAIRFIHCRHESGAAFAALEASLCSWQPTVVFTTAGPGLTNALTGMLAARWDGGHVILISAGTSPAQRGRWAAQESSSYTLPTSALFAPGPLFHFATAVESPLELEEIGNRLSTGLRRPQGFVAHLSLPLSVQTADATPPLLTHGNVLAAGCDTATAREVATMLAASPLVVWAGFGARGASVELRAFAERTGALVMCSARAKGVFPESHPQYLGVTGLGGHGEVNAYLQRHRPAHILVLGTRLGESTSFWSPTYTPGRAFVHVDVDPDVFGAAYPGCKTCGVQAEVGALLRALCKHWPEDVRHAPPPLPRPSLPTIAWRDSGPVRPSILCAAIQQAVVQATDAVLLAESGNSFAWASYALSFDKPERFRVSTGFGSMGHTTTGVLGAALARNGKAVALVGDGAMLMLNELSTAVRYGAQAVWIILNDACSGSARTRLQV